jgi:hypothetical protein
MRYVSAEGITAHHQRRDTASSHRTMAVTAFSERKGRCDLLSGTLDKLLPSAGTKARLATLRSKVAYAKGHVASDAERDRLCCRWRGDGTRQP